MGRRRSKGSFTKSISLLVAVCYPGALPWHNWHRVSGVSATDMVAWLTDRLRTRCHISQNEERYLKRAAANVHMAVFGDLVFSYLMR